LQTTKKSLAKSNRNVAKLRKEIITLETQLKGLRDNEARAEKLNKFRVEDMKEKQKGINEL
jgi:hypothetical protein